MSMTWISPLIFQVVQPQVSRRGRKRHNVASRNESNTIRVVGATSNVDEDSDTDLYEAEFELNDQKYIKKGTAQRSLEAAFRP